jgi:hypothetical protein
MAHQVSPAHSWGSVRFQKQQKGKPKASVVQVCEAALLHTEIQVTWLSWEQSRRVSSDKLGVIAPIGTLQSICLPVAMAEGKSTGLRVTLTLA